MTHRALQHPLAFLIISPALFRQLATAAAMLCLLALAPPALAQSSSTFDLPLVNTVGCAVIRWISGPLAIIVLFLVAVVVMLIGMIGKMDWSRILTVVIIYGIVQGLVGGALNLGVINPPAGCLR